MRSSIFRKLFLALPILVISFPAIAGYIVTSQNGDSAAAEVIISETQDSAVFLIIAEISGNASAITVNLDVNGDPATATFTDDFTLEFPSACPRNGGGGEITFSASPGGSFDFELDMGAFNGGGGAVGGGLSTFTCTVNINAVDDMIDEDSEDLNLTIKGPKSNVKDPLVQSFSISDNDTAALVATNTDWNGTDEIILSQKLTNESGLTATFWVELATEPTAGVTVNLTVSNPDEALVSSGVSGDLTILPLTFTSANWDSGQEVTMTGQDDNPSVQDGNIPYTVTIVAADGVDNKYDGLVTGPVNGVNEDNDLGPGQLRFTQSEQTGSEADAMTLTVDRINGSTGEVTVAYAITPGTATAPDYNDTTGSGGVLTFAEGVTSQDISITLVADGLWEPADEQFSVALGALTGGATLGTPSAQTITINPSDPILISVSPASPALAPEGDLGDPQVPVTFSVTYSGGALEAELPISWMTVDDTAIAPGDYEAVGATVINLPVNGDAVNIVAKVNGDNDPEGNETFFVQLSEAHDLVVLDDGGSSVGTIEDDDASDDGTFSITSIAPNPVMESAGSVLITVSRIGNTVDSAATINYATADNGSAVVGEDYTDTNGSLVWALDDAETFKTFSIPIADNADGEPDETFLVGITASASEVIGIDSGEITIIGDPTVTLAPSSYNVNENGGTVTVFVTRAKVDDEAVSVNYTTTNGSAMAGVDYTTKAGTLNWGPAVVGPMPIEITILPNPVETGPQSFTVDLSTCVNCTIDVGQATVNILEGDVPEPTPGTLLFNPTSLVVNEDTGSAGLIVTRTGGTDGAVTIEWTTMDGTATSPGDFTASTDTLSWADGVGGSQFATVPIIDDDEIEDTEMFTVMFVADSETGSGELPTVIPTPATVSITDNDSAEPGEFSILDINVNEGDGVINVTVTRDVGSTGDAAVTFTTISGTATGANPADPTDDFLYTTGTLNWADEDSASQTIPIQIVDDIEIETEEVFTVVLSSPVGATIADDTAEVVIFDNDGGGDFSVTDVTVFETQLEATVTVTRSNDNDTAAFVSWMTIDGTAEDENGDNDYKSDSSDVSGQLVWEAGDTSSTRDITIAIVPDDKDEGDEWFTVTITGVQGESVTISKADGVITIQDALAIPTLSQWAMGLLVLLLLGMGVYSLPLRSRVTITRK